MPSSTIRVLIVHDHPITRRGLAPNSMRELLDLARREPGKLNVSFAWIFSNSCNWDFSLATISFPERRCGTPCATQYS